MKIYNFTQHAATSEQQAAGVVDLPEEKQAYLHDLLTFDKLPDEMYIWQLADAIRDIALSVKADAVMVGGAPYLMSSLEKSMLYYGIRVFYAFSKRESIEQQQADGSVRKVNTFRHRGFVEITQ